MNQRKGLLLGVLLIVIAGTLLYTFFYRSSNETMSQDHTHENQSIYTCPMHPEIRENKPGSCPICHMKLVKVTDESSSETGETRQKNIKLNISPYQASLVGIKPVKAQIKVVSYSIPVSGRIISRATLALQVFENDLRFIKPGVSFRGRSEVYPEETIKGIITSVDNIADPSSRTIRVMGKINGGGQNLLSETSFSGEVEIELGEQLVVPEKSILFTGKGSFVYRYEDENLVPQKVILGPKVKEEYVVLEGLKNGDQISSGPNFLIDSESKIRGLND